ncbi:MAG TPA: sodium:proton exchanger [Micromonosporaceae bacterium]|nr:sodium:proton exchanger [Micromonosporaceae bacterium]
MSQTAVSYPPANDVPEGARPLTFSRSDLVIIGGSVAAMALAAIAFYAHLNEVLSFVCSGVAIALLAALVGRSVERLGDRLGAGATGVLQSALGNLPELFISFFALRAGLLTVVQSALIGSILANLLLVLGAAFLVGGLKHGTQRFDHGRARTTVVLLALATAALVLPSLAAQLHSPAGGHETQLSVAVAIILLAIFALSLPASLRRQAEPVMGRSLVVEQHPSPVGTDGSSTQQSSADGPPTYEATGGHDKASAVGRVETHAEGHWPIWLATGLLALAGVAAGLVSDWFVDALQPAIDALHISPAFAGLVIVAIAGNAVENVVGIQLAARNQADYAVSVIVNSPLQIALVLAPALVLLSFLTATTLTLVFAPLLVVSVVVAVIITAFIIFDGESNWLEGAILIALYAIIATLFWWG